MRQFCIFRINPGCYLVQAGSLRNHHGPVFGHAVIHFHRFELSYGTDMQFAFLIGLGKEKLYPYLVRIQISDIENYFGSEFLAESHILV